ncbi:response regulator [Piscicoccus intestinalis]|uniref:response regulator n=1 Tax=Piscicoccus intestinalis TaxID=746033 RepID=UPI000837B2F6|nr:response regulator [Piscicoccus intestinalis]
MRILLIEDELPLAKAVSRYLQGQGHTVLAVLDGVDGLHEAIESEPDLVLLDLTLPGLDGLEVLRGIRRRTLSLRSSS